MTCGEMILRDSLNCVTDKRPGPVTTKLCERLLIHHRPTIRRHQRIIRRLATTFLRATIAERALSRRLWCRPRTSPFSRQAHPNRGCAGFSCGTRGVRSGEDAGSCEARCEPFHRQIVGVRPNLSSPLDAFPPHEPASSPDLNSPAASAVGFSFRRPAPDLAAYPRSSAPDAAALSSARTPTPQGAAQAAQR
jgi:hypothetical protein